MEKRTQTLAELKGEEVTLRNRIEQSKGTVKDVIDLCRIRQIIVKLESVLLWSILTLLIFVVIGCQTAKGVAGDTGWILTRLSDNIQTEK